MNIAPVIACNVATQNAVRCAQMAAANAARAAEAEREYDEREDGDEYGEDEDCTLHIDDGSGLMFALCCVGGVVLIAMMALLLL